jgi:hypothetical protein
VKAKSQDSLWGLAVRPDLASVYYEYVDHLAVAYEFEVSSILGAVIAHEIGHLFLGPNSHYGIGIMRPHWSFEQVRQVMMGTLLFTPEQSKRIRAEARTRMSQQSASLREQNTVTVDQEWAGAIEPLESVCEYTWNLIPRSTQGMTRRRNGIGD